MKTPIYAALVACAAVITACGGSSDGIPGSTGAATGSFTSTGGTSGSTTGAAISSGSYAGSFSGSSSPTASSLGLQYSGTGSASISSTGAANFGYAAQTTNTGSAHFTENRSFVGKLDSKGNFTGTTGVLSSDGSTVQYLPATGAVVVSGTTRIRAILKWSLLTTTGAVYSTSTEVFNLSLK